MTPWVVIGNPENRRVIGFVEALAREGQPPPTVIAWSALLHSLAPLEALPATPHVVRIDSWGESFEVERGLLALGGFPEAEQLVEARGEVIAPHVSFAGMRARLEALHAFFTTRPSWRVLTPPLDVLELFDKRLTHRRFREAGLPVAEALDVVPTRPVEVLEALRARGWKQAFIKPAMGSSASGVLHLGFGPHGTWIHTSLTEVDRRWFNDLRMVRLIGPKSIDAAMDFVLSMGAHVERAIPKARFDGAFFDLRVLCVAGEPSFVVMRSNRHQITNLHLGGKRGDVAALERACPPGSWNRMLDGCRAAAACYPGMLQLGLDVLLEPGLRTHRIIEANAFGDLLPRLERDGRDVYRFEIHRAGMRSSNPSP